MAGPGVLDTGSQQQLFITYLTDLWPAPTSQGSNFSVAQDVPGAIRREFNGVYKCVQFGATSAGQVTAALAQGDIACYVLSAAAYYDQLIQVDEPNTAVGAGVVMASAGVPASNGPYRGWLMVAGTCTLDQVVSGSPSNGNELTVVSAAAKSLALKSAAASQTVAVMIDNSVTSAPVVNVNFPW